MVRLDKHKIRLLRARVSVRVVVRVVDSFGVMVVDSFGVMVRVGIRVYEKP